MVRVQVLFLFSIVRGVSRWRGQVVLSCMLRFAVKCLYELCLQAFYARRNRRNSPSMARFLLASASMPRHFCVLQHNSTVTKQLRYSHARQHRLPPPPASATYIIAPRSFASTFFSILDIATWLRPSTSATCFCVLSCIYLSIMSLRSLSSSESNACCIAI